MAVVKTKQYEDYLREVANAERANSTAESPNHQRILTTHERAIRMKSESGRILTTSLYAKLPLDFMKNGEDPFDQRPNSTPATKSSTPRSSSTRGLIAESRFSDSIGDFEEDEYLSDDTTINKVSNPKPTPPENSRRLSLNPNAVRRTSLLHEKGRVSRNPSIASDIDRFHQMRPLDEEDELSNPTTFSLKDIISKDPSRRTEYENKYLLKLLKNGEIFANLPARLQLELTQHVELDQKQSGQLFFEIGDEPLNIYILVSGRVRVREGYAVTEAETAISLSAKLSSDSDIRNGGCIDITMCGSIFGDSDIIRSGRRTISACAMDDTLSMIIPKSMYNKTIKQLESQDNTSRVAFLQKISPFESWTPASIARFQICLKPKTFSKNEVIFKVGDDATDVFLIRSGQVQLKTGRDKHIKSPHTGFDVCILGIGDMVGEVDAILQSKRDLTAIAASKVDVFVAKASEFMLRMDASSTETLTELAQMKKKWQDERIANLRSCFENLQYKTHENIAENHISAIHKDAPEIKAQKPCTPLRLDRPFIPTSMAEIRTMYEEAQKNATLRSAEKKRPHIPSIPLHQIQNAGTSPRPSSTPRMPVSSPIRARELSRESRNYRSARYGRLIRLDSLAQNQQRHQAKTARAQETKECTRKEDDKGAMATIDMLLQRDSAAKYTAPLSMPSLGSMPTRRFLTLDAQTLLDYANYC